MLINNQLVTFTVLAGIQSVDADVLADDIECFFTTRMVPLCASVSDVRRRVGAHIRSVPDDTINQLNLTHNKNFWFVIHRQKLLCLLLLTPDQ